MIELGSCVQVAYGTGEKKEIACVGGYTTEPVYFLVSASGHKYAWVRSLVSLCTHEEEIDYWRRRALIAEEAVETASRPLDGPQDGGGYVIEDPIPVQPKGGE